LENLQKFFHPSLCKMHSYNAYNHKIGFGP
jgi:hypothetical protein